MYCLHNPVLNGLDYIPFAIFFSQFHPETPNDLISLCDNTAYSYHTLLCTLGEVAIKHSGLGRYFPSVSISLYFLLLRLDFLLGVPASSSHV